MFNKYMVYGGEYTNTEFNKLIPGTEETHGPFHTMEEAKIIWSSRSWATVDICCYRFRIANIDNSEFKDNDIIINVTENGDFGTEIHVIRNGTNYILCDIELDDDVIEIIEEVAKEFNLTTSDIIENVLECAINNEKIEQTQRDYLDDISD